MTDHLKHLSAAREALLDADPQRCACEIEAFEAQCESHPPTRQETPALQAQLQALALMAEACTQGVQAARQGLQDALIAAGRLTTYDSAGARETRNTRGTSGRRY